MKLHKIDNKQADLLMNLKKQNPIKTIFKIIGAADAAANLLCEFKIAEKNDAKQTKNKNGKVILVKLIVYSIFESSPTNPGAINETNTGMKISTITTKKKKPKNKRLKILLANLFDYFYLLKLLMHNLEQKLR